MPYKYFILTLSIFLSQIICAQQSEINMLEKLLTGKEVWGKSWKISEIEKRELTKNGAVGNLENVKLTKAALGAFMASTKLPDSITFKVNRRFKGNTFTGNFWQGSSNNNHDFIWTAGIWELNNETLIWECPDSYVDNKKIIAFGPDYFIITDRVEYGSEAFEYFEYRVKYQLVDDGLVH